MSKKFLLTPWCPVFENDLDIWVPERWAQDALMELEPRMMAAQVVNRDWSPTIASYGDTVNVIRPGTFVAKRKHDRDEVTVQDADGTKIPVVLNQHIHTSFLIRDGEESKGMVSLRKTYLQPAMFSIAQALDTIVLGQVFQFKANCAGKLSTTPGRTTLIAARETLNTNLAPFNQRYMFITPSVEGSLLNTDDFVHVDKAGDTLALKEGSLGRKFGFDIHMCQNTPSVTVPGTVISTAINNASGYAAGATTVIVAASLTEAAMEGAWMTIAGDMQPHFITDYNNSTGATVFESALKYAVAHQAVVTVYDNGAINQSTTLNGLVTNGYPAGWCNDIEVDGIATIPTTAGRLLSMGIATNPKLYSTLLTEDASCVFLDRPLEAAVANDDVFGVGPVGEFCFGFHPNAMTLVMRPLAIPEAGAGAKGFVATYKNLGLRVVITYDGYKQGHLVTIDMLAGIKVLDSRLGVVMYA